MAFQKARAAAGKILGALRLFSPPHKVIIALARGQFNSPSEGTWKHDPVKLYLKHLGTRVESNSLWQSGTVMHEISSGAYAVSVRLPENPVIVDCGANTGLVTIYLSRKYGGAKVYAIEASSENHELLKQNTNQLEGVTATRAAVSDEHGKEGKLFLSERGIGSHSLFRKQVKGTHVGTESVPLLRLDQYMKEQGLDKIDLLKLDIEGSELKALKGLGKKLNATGVIVGEVHAAVVDPEKFKKFLETRGFRITKWEAADQLHTIFEAVNSQVHKRASS